MYIYVYAEHTASAGHAVAWSLTDAYRDAGGEVNECGDWHRVYLDSDSLTYWRARAVGTGHDAAYAALVVAAVLEAAKVAGLSLGSEKAALPLRVAVSAAEPLDDGASWPAVVVADYHVATDNEEPPTLHRVEVYRGSMREPQRGAVVWCAALGRGGVSWGGNVVWTDASSADDAAHRVIVSGEVIK